MATQPTALAQWATNDLQHLPSDNGGTAADVVDFTLDDEANWSYADVPAIGDDPPSIGMLSTVRNNAVFRSAFISYLQQRGLQPAAVGHTDWDSVEPIANPGASGAVALEARRLFYWSMRFFSFSAANAVALAGAVLEDAFQDPLRQQPLRVCVFWMNEPGQFYTPLPPRGWFQWMDSGRLSTHMLCGRDIFSDQDAQKWSYVADALRCASMLGTQHGPGTQRGFGGLLQGSKLGDHPHGASYKILSLIGHGAKLVDVYTFGPSPVTVDTWSELTYMYKPLAAAFRLIGRAERLLHPGQPDRGKVALLLPYSSSLWDTDDEPRMYGREVLSLHYALVHAGYTVDVVDDTDLQEGALEARGYKALYVTGPNVPQKAQEAISSWVKEKGGIVAVSPGAAVADEFNSPLNNNDFEALLGLEPGRVANRDNIKTPDGIPTGTVTVVDPTFGTGSAEVFGPFAAPPLVPTTGAVAATLSSGKPAVTMPAITVNKWGAGYAIAYGFYPGWQYWQSPGRPTMV